MAVWDRLKTAGNLVVGPRAHWAALGATTSARGLTVLQTCTVLDRTGTPVNAPDLLLPPQVGLAHDLQLPHHARLLHRHGAPGQLVHDAPPRRAAADRAVQSLRQEVGGGWPVTSLVPLMYSSRGRGTGIAWALNAASCGFANAVRSPTMLVDFLHCRAHMPTLHRTPCTKSRRAQPGAACVQGPFED